MRLLLVEDDRMIGDSLRAALRLEGHAVDWVRDARAAAATLASERFDRVLLDLGLPQGDGLDVLRAFRAQPNDTPVIVLTARDGTAERVAGLDAGADDYLVKPFEFDELLARMRAVQRRHGGRAALLLHCGAVTLHPATRQVAKDGAPVLLSARTSSATCAASAATSASRSEFPAHAPAGAAAGAAAAGGRRVRPGHLPSVLAETEALFDYQLRQMAL